MKKTIQLMLCIALFSTASAQMINQNVQYTRTAMFSGRAIVQDTMLLIKSGNDTIKITSYGDTSRISTTAGGGFKFSPPLPGGGGSGSQNLQEVTDEGNATTTGILLDNSALQLDNGSSLSKGTNDYGFSNGISLFCSIGYEMNWQGGVLAVFDNAGFVREANHCLNIVPDSTFDEIRKFKAGSRWVLDDGTSYVCTDATVGSAVWELQGSGGATTPTLQDVVAEGNVITENAIEFQGTDGVEYILTASPYELIFDVDGGLYGSKLDKDGLYFSDNDNGYASSFTKNSISFTDNTYGTTRLIQSTNHLTTEEVILPDTSGQLALVSQLPPPMDSSNLVFTSVIQLDSVAMNGHGDTFSIQLLPSFGANKLILVSSALLQTISGADEDCATTSAIYYNDCTPLSSGTTEGSLFQIADPDYLYEDRTVPFSAQKWNDVFYCSGIGKGIFIYFKNYCYSLGTAKLYVVLTYKIVDFN